MPHAAVTGPAEAPAACHPPRRPAPPGRWRGRAQARRWGRPCGGGRRPAARRRALSPPLLRRRQATLIHLDTADRLAPSAGAGHCVRACAADACRVLHYRPSQADPTPLPTTPTAALESCPPSPRGSPPESVRGQRRPGARATRQSRARRAGTGRPAAPPGAPAKGSPRAGRSGGGLRRSRPWGRDGITALGP